MIEYNRHSWWKTVCSFRGTALPRAVNRVVVFVLYAVVIQTAVSTLESTGWGFSHRMISLDPVAHAVLGSLLGFLIVFRMNASNNRYWEGRALWGSIINSSRNITRFGSERSREGTELAGLVSGYAIALKQSLRGSRNLEEASEYVSPAALDEASRFGNMPTAMAAGITSWIVREQQKGTLDSLMAHQMEDFLSKLVDAQGGCERIQKTPLPFVYVAMIKQLILVYLLTLPLVLFDRCGWWSPLMVAVVALGLFGMEEASVETEDPFGTAENCLDLDTFTLTIARDAGQLAARIEKQRAGE